MAKGESTGQGAVRTALRQNEGKIESWMTCAIGYDNVLRIWNEEGFCYAALNKLYKEEVA